MKNKKEKLFKINAKRFGESKKVIIFAFLLEEGDRKSVEKAGKKKIKKLEIKFGL